MQQPRHSDLKYLYNLSAFQITIRPSPRGKTGSIARSPAAAINIHKTVIFVVLFATLSSNLRI